MINNSSLWRCEPLHRLAGDPLCFLTSLFHDVIHQVRMVLVICPLFDHRFHLTQEIGGHYFFAVHTADRRFAAVNVDLIHSGLIRI